MNHLKWRDLQQIDRLRKGDPQLRQDLYDDYAPVFYSSICRLVPLKGDGERLLMEVFVCIFRQLRDFDPERQSLFSWMHAIVQRHLVNWHEIQRPAM